MSEQSDAKSKKSFWKELFPAKPLDKKQIKREVKSYIVITLCLCIYAFALVMFIINSNIVSGGVNGIATLLYYASGHRIPVGISAFVINAVLLVIGFKILGNAFGFKTIWAIFFLSFFVTIWQGLLKQPVLDQDPFLSAVIGGALIGLAVGTAFNYGGSTGGTDIVALIITKFHNVSPGRVILYCDLCIISSSFIVFYYFLGKTPEESLRVVLYGFVVMTVTSYTIDLIVMGAQSSVQMLISSRKHEEIAKMISTEMHRGVTLLDAKGFYSKEQSNVLFAVVRKYEMQNVLRRIRDIDPDAFTSVTQATGVYGKGFQALK
ncbi:MAG: YitT family protein [Bacteroidales bacterium]|nr:YitT family protein [Bacteroidales bacterium]